MSAQAWWTLAVVVVTLAVMASERISPPVVVMGSVTVLLATRVVDAKQALSGFSNEAPLTIAALYVLTAAAERTGALDLVTRLATGRRPAAPDQRGPTRRELARLLPPAAAVSTFIYNTPTTSLLAPQAAAWARRSGRVASWYLLPLNYVIILAGLITAIGTTTNVVVSGLLTGSGRRALGLFELAPVGLPLLAAGGAAVLLLSGRLMPTRQSPTDRLAARAREFTVEMAVPAGSPLAGATVQEAGLRNLEGVYLVQVEHDGRRTAPVPPETVLAAGSRLTFVGNVTRVVDLHRVPGLVSAEQPHFALDGPATASSRLYEGVVGPNSPLVGRTLKEVGFRGRYDAAVVGIHRAGEQVPGKLGTQRLHGGDVLLLLAGETFGSHWRDTGDFLVLAPLDGALPPPRRKQAPIVALCLVGFLVAAATGVVSVLEASLIAALAVVATGVLSPREAKEAIDLEVIVVLAGSFGLGAAIAQSGLAREVAQLLVDAGRPAGHLGQLAGVLVATVVVTQLVTNNAAAIVMYPIALATAAGAGLDPRPFVIAVTIGASASFLTPIGYQTNMIVYGMAGYRFTDFLRLGAVLVALLLAISLAIIPVVWPLS